MRLEVSFRVLNKNLDVDFSAKDKKLNAEFQCFQRITEQGDVDYYDGSYTVTPKVEEQSLPTSKKISCRRCENKRNPDLRGEQPRRRTNSVYWKEIIKNGSK